MEKKTPQSEPDVTNNTALSRFEITINGQTAVLEYTLWERQIIFPHTEVPEALSGQGIGSRLARAGLDYARSQGLQVVPACEFMEGFIERHPEYQDLMEKPQG
jgi:uncharacterized protein